MARGRDRQWAGEIEFEFVPEATGEGRFVLSGSVVGQLRRLLAQGQVLEAAKTLSQVSGEVGDELVEEIADASAISRANLVQMFVEARDYTRAARCCERAGDHARAGDFFERAGHMDRAAAAFLRAGELERAAQVLERDLEFERAAELYAQARRFLKAAQSYERAGRFYAAGELYEKLAKWPKAAEMLSRVAPHEPEYLKATLLLGKVLSAARQHVMATQCYRSALQAHGLRQDTVEIQYRLATLLRETDRGDEAARLLRDLDEVSPGFRDVAELLAAPLSPATLDRRELDALSELDQRESDLAATPVGPLGVVGIEADVEFLRRVPLFAELSAGDLHEFLPHWETVRHPAGSVVLREGDEGQRLYVIKRGRARVVHGHGDLEERLLRVLDEGAYFGELSLVRDRPASASVIAEGPLVSLALDRASFERLVVASDRFAARIYRVFLATLIERFVEMEAALVE